MKKQMSEKIEIPEGVSCSYESGKLTCRKDSAELSREIKIPQTQVKVGNNEIVLQCGKGSKNQYKIIKSNIAHIKNMFLGLQDKFVYELEAVSVHFPMTLKAEGDKLTIGNFLGEKTPRHAKILANVEVEIKGQKIKVSSSDREAAGQTAANLEKAAKLKGRDRRIFQDGIFIVEKPRRKS
ncbi:MAG: 50S ribosomal protein L6 [Nanoarchaeota archaeon]